MPSNLTPTSPSSLHVPKSKSTLRSQFPPHSPPLNRYNQNNPSHQKRDGAHRDGKHEHRIQPIILHSINRISRLSSKSVLSHSNPFIIQIRKKLTLAIKTIPPAINPKAVIISVGGLPGKIEVGGEI